MTLKSARLILFFFFILFRGNSFAQGEAAVPFLLLQPGPALNGMGGAVTALPERNAYGFFYNPALSGTFAATDNFSFAQTHVNWLPQFNFSDLYVSSGAISLGYDLSRLNSRLPLQVGMSLMQLYLNLGTNVWTDEYGNVLGTFHSSEYYNAYNISAQLNIRLKIAFGVTYKQVASNLAQLSVSSENRANTFKGHATDVGLLLRFPFFPASDPSHHNKKRKNFALLPILDISSGVALNNMGPEVIYTDYRRKDPLPRQAKLGLGVTAGLASWIHHVYLKWVQLSYSSEANDLLIKRSEDGSYAYQQIPGDINILNHIFLAKGDENVINRKGAELNIMEIVRIRAGSWFGHGYTPRIQSAGFSIGSRGILKVVTAFANRSFMRRFINHFDLAYNWSRYSVREEKDHPLEGTTFQSLSINVYGF